jgi:hypothetical protein
MFVYLFDMVAEGIYSIGNSFGENSELLLCRLENGVVFSFRRSMIKCHGDQLLKRVTVIIDRVDEAVIHNYWISLRMKLCKSLPRKIDLVHLLDGCYSFNLVYMQSAFYLLWMALCLSSLFFVVDFMYNNVFIKIM